MARKSKSIYENETCLRLIDAAGRLFAEKGYDATTIQDICALSGANIAAVNYHFGSKMKLYEATLKFTLIGQGQEDGEEDKQNNKSAEDALFELVWDMIKSIRLTDKPEWFPQLLRREMMFPTAEFQEFSQRLIKEDFKKIESYVQEILPDAKKNDVKACALGLFGQVKSVAMESDVVLAMLFPALKMDEKGCKKIARHITDTAVAGMRAVYG